MSVKRKRNTTRKVKAKLTWIKEKSQAWVYINRERKKKIEITTEINIEEWRKYFKDLLDGEDTCTKVWKEE